MTVLSILTACLPAQADHMEETSQSVYELREKFAQEDVVIEWIVCYDGPGETPEIESIDKIVRLRNHCGVAVARNVALAHSTGDLITVLDADDLIVYDGVLKALNVFKEKDHVAWVAGNRTNLAGEKDRHWHGKASWGSRWLAWDWTSPFPFHPSTVVIRREAALDLGGWPALPACEDTGFILELSEAYSGLAIAEILIKHREWDKQAIRHEGYLAEKEQAYIFLENYINNKRTRRGDPLITRPLLT